MPSNLLLQFQLDWRCWMNGIRFAILTWDLKWSPVSNVDCIIYLVRVWRLEKMYLKLTTSRPDLPLHFLFADDKYMLWEKNQKREKNTEQGSFFRSLYTKICKMNLTVSKKWNIFRLWFPRDLYHQMLIQFVCWAAIKFLRFNICALHCSYFAPIERE